MQRYNELQACVAYVAGSQAVLTPGASKLLHLYEPQYLRMLEDCLASRHQLMAHVVIEHNSSKQRGGGAGAAPAGRAAGAPASPQGMVYRDPDFSLHLGTLVRVKECRQLQKGCLVRVQAEGRIAVASVTQVRQARQRSGRRRRSASCNGGFTHAKRRPALPCPPQCLQLHRSLLLLLLRAAAAGFTPCPAWLGHKETHLLHAASVFVLPCNAYALPFACLGASLPPGICHTGV